MKKNGIYFAKQPEIKEEQEKSLKRKGIFTALIFAALTLAAAIIYIIVRGEGKQYFVPLFLVLAVVAASIEVYWSNPDKKSYVLWKKLFNRQ